MRRIIATLLTAASLIFGTAIVGAAPANAAPICRQYIYKQGGDGTCVKAIQALVSTVGVRRIDIPYVGPGIAIDGKFGPATRTAIVKLQSRTGLAADGVVGPKTWSKLCSGHYVGSTSMKKLARWAYNYACV